MISICSRLYVCVNMYKSKIKINLEKFLRRLYNYLLKVFIINIIKLINECSILSNISIVQSPGKITNTSIAQEKIYKLS